MLLAALLLLDSFSPWGDCEYFANSHPNHCLQTKESAYTLMHTLWIQIFGISQEIGTKEVWRSLVLGGKMLPKAFCYRYWILCIYFSTNRSNIWQVGKKRQELWLCPDALEHRVLSFKYLKHLIMYSFHSETKIYFLQDYPTTSTYYSFHHIFIRFCRNIAA